MKMEKKKPISMETFKTVYFFQVFMSMV
jgi:hypothetical protein